MKRKVIQIANSIQLVSLPRRWALQFGIKKGDELEVLEKGSKIEISTEKCRGTEKVTLDVSELDRSSLIYYLRAAYRRGFELIEIRFDKALTTYFRNDTKLKILSIIHKEVDSLIGIEIIQQKESFCLIKSVSDVSFDEFDTLFRRVFILYLDAVKDFVDAIKNNDFVMVETIEEKHRSITKFVSYCLRLLNKKGFSSQVKSNLYYHTLETIDKLSHTLKYGARFVNEKKLKINKKAVKIVENIEDSIRIYYDLFYKFNLKKVTQFYENREKTLNLFYAMIKDLNKDEIIVLEKLNGIPELLVGLTHVRMAIEFPET